MANPIKIADGAGSGKQVKVVNGGSLLTTVTPYPPFEEEVKLSIYNQPLTLNGDGTTFDMTVDGSTTSQKFYITADSDKDLYIRSLSFIIGDAGAELDEFGNLPALTNGCRLYYEDETGEEIIIGQNISTNWEFIRLCNANPTFGSGASVFRANNVEGSTEAYIPILNIVDTFGFQWGLKLKAESTQKLVLEVNDDVTTLDSFNCVAKGFTRKVPK